MLERWIAETPFREAEAPAQSDLDVAKGANAKEILEQHWDTWITEADWAWLAEKGINTVRIPVSSYIDPHRLPQMWRCHSWTSRPSALISLSRFRCVDRLLSSLRRRSLGPQMHRLRGA